MKLYKSALGAAVAVLVAAALGGCAESPLVDGIDSVGNPSPGAYFLEPANKSLSITQLQDNLILTFGRAGETGAASYGVSFTYPDDYAPNVQAMFSAGFPSTVSFEQGETGASVTIPYDASAFPYDVHVPITAQIGADQATAYGNSTITIDVFRSKYGPEEILAKEGTAAYYYALWDQEGPVGVYQHASVLDPNDMEVGITGWFSNISDLAPEDDTLYFTYDAETNVVRVPQVELPADFDEDGGVWYYADLYTIYHDVLGYDDDSDPVQQYKDASYYDPRTGRFNLLVSYFTPTTTGISWYGGKQEYIQLPGYADYTIEAGYMGALFQDSDKKDYAMFNVFFPKKTDAAYAVCGIVETEDASEAVSAVLAGSVPTDTVSVSGAYQLPVDHSGVYRIACVPFSEADEAQPDAAAVTAKFKYTTRADLSAGQDPNKGWKQLGTCQYTDDYLPCMFNGIDPYTYEVPIQEKEDQPGYYRLVGPYQACNPMLEPGDYDDSEPYYLEIDACDPTGVYIPLQPSGLTVTDAEICLYSLAAYYLDNGNSVDAVKNAGYFGNLVDGEITFPVKGLCFTEGEDGPYYANSNGAFRVVLPEAVNGAPLKSARRPSSFTSRFNRTMMLGTSMPAPRGQKGLGFKKATKSFLAR